MISWTPNPFYFDFGRPFPSKQVLSLFEESKIFSSLDTKKTAHIYEPCAGTGRVIVPLAIHYPQINFTASDISEVSVQRTHL
jgi:methylase of polypeptide subunit release factors